MSHHLMPVLGRDPLVMARRLMDRRLTGLPLTVWIDEVTDGLRLGHAAELIGQIAALLAEIGGDADTVRALRERSGRYRATERRLRAIGGRDLHT